MADLRKNFRKRDNSNCTEEPDALIGHVRICGGPGVGNHPGLPDHQIPPKAIILNTRRE